MTEHLTLGGKFIAVRHPHGVVDILAGGTRRLITRAQATETLVNAAAVSPDGRTVAFHSGEGGIRFVDRMGKTLPPLGLAEGVRALAYSPDGRFLAVGREDGSVLLVGNANLQEVDSLKGHDGPVIGVAISPDGRLLAALALDGELRMWEIASGVEVFRAKGIRPGGRLAFDRRSRSLYHADFAVCKVTRWDLRTGKQGETETLSRLEVKPEIVLKKDEKQSLRVLAHWSGGREEDVTPACVFESLDPETVSVSPSGEVCAVKPGRAVVRVRHFGRMTACNVFVSFEGPARPFDFQPANFIDEIAAARWKQLGLQPAGVAPDPTFLRRASLVLIGRPPTPEEVRAFQKSVDPRKCEKFIAGLLDSPDHTKHWSDFWLEALSVDGEKRDEKQMADFREWARRAIADNRPLDRIVADLVRTNVGIVGQNRTPEQHSRAVARAFLGVDLECSSCHPAPGQAWGYDAATGFAAIFGGTGKEPRVPGQPPLVLQRDETPREAFARWLTTDNRKALARVFVSRVWEKVVGTPLVDPSEPGRAGNVPVFPELLDALAEDFLKHDQDVKHLLRTITTSRLFMLDNKPAVPGANSLLVCRTPQRLSNETLSRLLEPVAGGPITWHGISSPSDGEPKCAYCRTERQPPPAALFLMSSLDENSLAQPKGVIVRMMAAGRADQEIIEELFLHVLSRLPKEEEMKTVVRHMQKEAGDRRRALTDILWALINSREFLFIG
jgi:hypothetical protein